MNITLEPYEIIMGAMVGVRRRVSSIAKKLDRGSTQGDPWGIDVEGALAEVAALISTGKPISLDIFIASLISFIPVSDPDTIDCHCQ